MPHTKTTLKILTLSIGLFFVFSTTAHAEVIKSFDSQITVNPDASVSVVETIVYDSEGLEKHGIYRDITPRNAKGEKMMLKDISVATPSGSAYQWSRLTDNGNVRLKIGDPNATFAGEKIYVIRYTATNAVSYFDSYDEIYWNVTGNAWPFAIQKASASILLPDTTTALQQACYVGPIGSKETCDSKAVRSLGAGEGFTIAASFPKGIVTPYMHTTQDKIAEAVGLWWPVSIPIITCIYMFRKWHRIGRDAKGRGTIVPEYDVVDNLTPLEAAVIINQSFSGKDIIAEVLSLAVRGYIKIEQTEEKKFIGKHIDYTLTLTKLPDETPPLFDKQLLQEIFDHMTVGSSTILSQNHSLYAITGSLTTTIRKRLVENGYYTKDFLPKSFLDKVSPTGKHIKYFGLILALFVVFLQSPLSKYLWSALDLTAHEFGRLFVQELTPIVFVISIIISAGLYAFFKSIMPAKTKKGALAREHLLGLKEYIRVAEKDRIAFHNAPETNPKLFEALLPYAVMFGLEKKWAKAFEGLTLPQPSWYVSHYAFVASAFMSDFSQNFSSNFFVAPSTSGSGGGGFSGGGGGGGGGGSW